MSQGKGKRHSWVGENGGASPAATVPIRRDILAWIRWTKESVVDVSEEWAGRLDLTDGADQQLGHPLNRPDGVLVAVFGQRRQRKHILLPDECCRYR